MTTISGAFPAPVPAAAEPQVASATAATPVSQPRPMVGSGVADRLGRAARVVAADVAAAWPWRGTPPALAEMWAGRVPALDEVPGRNRVLWVGWSVYNHAVLPVVAVSYVALWVLAHPARFGLAAAVAAPIVFIWI